MRKKSKKKKKKLWPMNEPMRSELAEKLMLTCFILLTSVQLIESAHFYVHLPKFGLINGINFEPESAGEPEVAAFLGIPYAAPPTSLLRLMPPGAVQASSGSSSQQQQQQWARLEPSGRRAQVRAHSRFGSECVHLPDWLEEWERKKSSNSNLSSQLQLDRAELELDEWRRERRLKQNEDCLNLNLFVPLAFMAPNSNVGRFSPNASNSAAHDDQLAIDDSTSGKIGEAGAANSIKQQQQQQIKSNYPSHATNRNDPNEDQKQEQQSLLRANHSIHSNPVNQVPRPLWPLPKRQRALPVLVLFHGFSRQNNNSPSADSHRANSLKHLSTCRATNSIVVTFNYRIGLLGFLPYVDQRQQPSSKVPSGGGNSNRHNHAIWDQIGLLHWLKHNALTFNGDPQNLTLMALDNEAAQLVQLLTMSPLAKGLFQRAVLVVDHESGNKLTELGVSDTPTNELWSKLGFELERVVESLFPNLASLKGLGSAYEFIQLEANLSQLALIDRELSLRFNPNVTADRLILDSLTTPTLEDKLLFPQLVSLRRSYNLDFLLNQPTVEQVEAENANVALQAARAELNYCAYLRQLHSSSSSSDYLKLVGSNNSQKAPKKRLRVQATHPSNYWHPPASTNQTSFVSSDSTRVRLSKAKRNLNGANFDQLHNLNLLTRLLSWFWAEENRNVNLVPASDNESERSDNVPEEDIGALESEELEVSRPSREQQSAKLEDSSSSVLKRRASDTDGRGLVGLVRSQQRTDSNDLSQLMNLLSSFDLLLGLVPTKKQKIHQVHSQNSSIEFSQISKLAYLRIHGHSSTTADFVINPQTISWFRFADLHFMATRLANESISQQFCDYSTTFGSKEATLNPVRNTYAFVLDKPYTSTSGARTEENEPSSWLSESNSVKSNFVEQNLANFIKFGQPFDKQEVSLKKWSQYDSLSRKLKRISEEKVEEKQLASAEFKLAIQLDLVPYLSQLARMQLEQKVEDNNSIQQQLSSCLIQINSTLELHWSKRQSPKSGLTCLAHSIARFRARLLEHAAEDLGPLKRALLMLAEENGSRKGSSAITTRNLLDGGQDQVSALETTGELSSEPQDQSLDSLAPTTTPTSNENYTGEGEQPAAEIFPSIHSSGFHLRGFLTNAYKETSGRALAMVVGAGVLIILLNITYLAITGLKTARGRRNQVRSEQQGSSIEGDNELESSNETAQVAPPALKKPNLKRRSNDQHSSAADTPSIVATNCSKQLKFDLSGLGRGESQSSFDIPSHHHHHHHHHSHHSHHHLDQLPVEVFLDHQTESCFIPAKIQHENSGFFNLVEMESDQSSNRCLQLPAQSEEQVMLMEQFDNEQRETLQLENLAQDTPDDCREIILDPKFGFQSPNEQQHHQLVSHRHPNPYGLHQTNGCLEKRARNNLLCSPSTNQTQSSATTSSSVCRPHSNSDRHFQLHRQHNLSCHFHQSPSVCDESTSTALSLTPIQLTHPDQRLILSPASQQVFQTNCQHQQNPINLPFHTPIELSQMDSNQSTFNGEENFSCDKQQIYLFTQPELTHGANFHG